ncbi:ORF 73-like protein [Cryptosporidium canis]|nr:ORF 73-like protein [Cryptosporidium canis]
MDLQLQRSQNFLGQRISEIERSTRRLVENETRRFEAYVDILRDQMVGMSELEHEKDVLQEEVARVTEQLSLREMDMESKERRIFELEKSVRDVQDLNRGYERELKAMTKEKNDLRSQLDEMSIKIEKLVSKGTGSGDYGSGSGGEKSSTSRGKSKRAPEEHDAESTPADKTCEEAPKLKKSRLRRPQNEEGSESKRSIGKEAESVGKEENPLKDVIGRTNLGRLRAPLLRSRVVKAAEAASPEVESVPELKTLEKERSGSGRQKKSASPAEPKKSSKKTSKVAKIAKIPHYTENILNSMKVAELKDICSKLQLEVGLRARKSDLIQSILSFQGE